MELTMEQAMTQVKKYIETADEAQAHLVFFDRHGEIDTVAEQADDNDAFIRLMEEARARSGGPYFEILSMLVGGAIMICGDFYPPKISDADLQRALEEADSSRTAFYEERAKEFGASAYPTRRMQVGR